MKKRKFGRIARLISLGCAIVLTAGAIFSANAAYVDSRTGDIDGDGVISIKDVLALDAMLYCQSATIPAGADVNYDNVVDDADISAIFSEVMGHEREETYYLKAGSSSGLQIATYHNYSVAKNTTSKTGMLGYALYAKNGKLAYSENSEFVSKFLAQAKSIADYCKTNNFSYGSSAKNPAIDSSEKVVSCDRFVGWVLYNSGFTNQPADQGMFVYSYPDKSHDLVHMLPQWGWTKITNQADLKAGDIVFVNPAYTSQSHTEYPSHVFICAGKYKDDIYFRYDMGTQNRIRCSNETGNNSQGYSCGPSKAEYNTKNPYITAVNVSGQPFAETISNFMYAFRYTG